MKKIIFLITFLILFMQITYAESSFIQSSKDIISNTFLIVTNKQSTYPKESDINLHIHIFNSSGILITNSSASCTFHFYNQTNYHLITSNMDFAFDGFNYTIPSNYTSKLGIYAYDIWCNVSGIGGVVSTQFEITEDGTPRDDNFVSMTIISFTGFIIIFFLILAYIIKYFPIRVILVSLSIIFFIVGLNITLQLAKDNGISNKVINLLTTIYTVSFDAGIFIILFGGFITLMYYIKKYSSIPRIK